MSKKKKIFIRWISTCWLILIEDICQVRRYTFYEKNLSFLVRGFDYSNRIRESGFLNEYIVSAHRINVHLSDTSPLSAPINFYLDLQTRTLSSSLRYHLSIRDIIIIDHFGVL